MQAKLKTLLSKLNHGLVEREETLKIALLTVLAGENIVLIGPPGTGKSMLARRISDGLPGGEGEYFEYLLTKFSTPEEIFGPLSITELKKDRFKRNTAGYLPTVKMAFLDEIFKASSSILNSLLTILNERIYHNGAEPQPVPMRALIAASNELPAEQEELSALYDRFLVRRFVDYVKPEHLHKLFEKSDDQPILDKLTAAELDQIQRDAQVIEIPEYIRGAILRIWEQHKETFKEDRRESLSDRRLKKVLHLLRVSAATNGRQEVDLSDVLLLKNCLWNHQENAIKVSQLILNTLRILSYSEPQPEFLASSQTEIYKLFAESLARSISLKPITDLLTNPSGSTVKSDNAKGIIKGFKGSGTIQDPLLIESVRDLMDLSRPDVGLQGYHFRQTCDIDCSDLTHWTDIDFIGNYDGAGFTIKYDAKLQKLASTTKETNLFRAIQTNSLISNIKLSNLRLAKIVEGSWISRCTSDLELISHTATGCNITYCKAGGNLIQNSAVKCVIDECISNLNLINNTATDCKIIACNVRESLIKDSAFNCVIEGCHASNVLIKEKASNCRISDCLVTLDYQGNNGINGGVASILSEDSHIERCFVSGRANNARFYGISATCDASSIRGCAIGRVEGLPSGKCSYRITGELRNGGKLENNASIDSNPGTNERDGRDGATFAALIFDQRFFENMLNWDFNSVWQWDNTENRPALRTRDIEAARQANADAPQIGMFDLLAQQVRANIWL